MRRIGPALLAATLALAAPAARAQSEMELYMQEGNRMLDAHRDELRQYAQLAGQAIKDKDFRTARKYAQQLTRGDPKRAEAWLILGAAQLGLEDWSAARGTYSTAVRLAPDSPEAHGGLGVAYARTRDARAQQQLAWFATTQAACGTCWQSRDLARFRTDVESAVAVAASTAPPAR